MDIIGTIASVVAAFTGIISIAYTKRMSKGSIRRRIEKKQKQIHEIEIKLVRMRGMNTGRYHQISPLDKKISKLQAEIDELQKEL